MGGTVALFVLTACSEIIGCYLPYLWLRHGRSTWWLVPSALSLALFVWLLTLHPQAAGRTYAAYGGVYVATAVAWLWSGWRSSTSVPDSSRLGGSRADARPTVAHT